MAKIKHNPDAKFLIDEAIHKAQPFAQAICIKLRALIFTAAPGIIEDWKWGPNYYSNGMVCGFWHFKKHVTFVFFQGALLKDKKQILHKNPGNLHNRHLKFADAKEIDEKLIIEYIREAVSNNAKGNKLIETEDKTIMLPDDLKKILAKNKLLIAFEAMAYSHRKEYVNWISEAKKEDTRIKRIDATLVKLKSREKQNDKYKK